MKDDIAADTVNAHRRLGAEACAPAVAGLRPWCGDRVQKLDECQPQQPSTSNGARDMEAWVSHQLAFGVQNP